MASFEETVQDDACAFESVGPTITSVYTESCEGADELAFSLTFVVADVGNFTDALASDWYFVLGDEVKASDSLISSRTASATDAIEAGESLASSLHKLFTDAIEAADTAAISDVVFSILDSVVATGTLVATRTHIDAAYDSALIAETFAPLRMVTVADAIRAYESNGTHLSVIALDVVRGTESVARVRTSYETLEDAITAGDALSSHLVAVATIIDGLLAEEVIKTLPAELRTAYWTNPKTTAAARWDALSVNSIVEIDGRVFGATDAGIVELTPTAGSVEAKVVWDLLDFGVAEQKRAMAAYVAGTSTKPFVVRVTTKQGGWDYSTHRVAGSTHMDNHYTPLGRGLLSRYFRFAVSNTDGAPFDFSDVRAMLDATKRRRGG